MVCKRAVLLLSAWCLLSWGLPAQEAPLSSGEVLVPQERLLTLLSLIHKLQLSGKTRNEQYEALLELSGGNSEQLKVLKEQYGLSEQDVTLLKSITMTQGEYINGLSKQIAEMNGITQKQSALLKKSLGKTKALRISICIAVPVAAGLGAWGGFALARALGR
jgi:hypothetical protein